MAKMKNRCRFGLVLGVSLLLVCVSLSGCIMVPYETTPKADLSNVKSVAISEKRNITFERNVEVIAPMAGGAEQVRQYWGAFDDRAMRVAARRNPHVGILETKSAFSSCENDLLLRIECRYEDESIGQFFSGMTIGIIPFPSYHSWQYDFTVRDRSGRAAQYHFEDGWRYHISPFLLFAMPFYDTSFETVADRVLGNVYDQLFLSMQKDGFFDPPPKQAVPAPSGSNAVSSDRLKELESLKAAGVISEDEYRREVERLGKTGGK